jgi:hypothetical protein
MVSQKSQQSVKERPVNSVAALSKVSERLIKREQAYSGADFEDAIKHVATRIRAAPGSLYNVVKQRVKSVSFELRDKIVAEALNTLQRDAQVIEHERQLVLQISGPCACEMDRLDGALARVQEAMSILREGHI